MLINSVGSANYNCRSKKFYSFKSRVITDYPAGSATIAVKELVDKFEESSYLFKRLGDGKCSIVYLLDEARRLVVKKSKELMETTNNCFKGEADILSQVPVSFPNSQHFNTRVLTEKGNYYLVSTFKSGQPVRYSTDSKMSTTKINSVLDSIFNLDKNGIYHNDLNSNNILWDGFNANLIDYQWGAKFKPYINNEQTNVFFPKSIIPSNVLNYEQTGFASYLHKFSRDNNVSYTRSFFKDYLKAKSKYHEKRYEYFKYNAQNADENYYLDSILKTHNKSVYSPLKYERALAKVYVNPNEDVVDIELMRMEFLRSQRKSYQFTDPNIYEDMNSFNSLPYIANSVYSLNNLKSRLQYYAEKYKDDKYMRRYVRYNNEIANYFSGLYANWFNGTYKYLDSLSIGAAKINQTKNIDKVKNGTRFFEKVHTFEDIISSQDKRTLLSVDNSLKYDMKKYLSSLTSESDYLLRLKMLKNWLYPFWGEEKTTFYKQVSDVDAQVKQIVSLINSDRPIDSACVALNLRLICRNLYNTSWSNQEIEGMSQLNASIYRIENTIDSFLEKIRKELILMLEKPNGRISSSSDLSLRVVQES